jgi:transketolase
MLKITLIPQEEFRRVQEARIDKYEKLEILAGMCRANTLAAVKRAGSGHLGSSFSSMEIFIWLYYQEMNTLQVGLDDPHRDIFFSSKGHDVPGLYSVLFSLGVLPQEKLLKLRRLGGLDGHPDIGIPGIEANSGSLGMGISKGRGMAWAKRYRGWGGRVFVMTGDGELQEGQNFEALQSGAHQKVSNLTVIVDHNKLQTDKKISEITDLGDLDAKFRDFGWHVARCDGHDLQRMEQIFAEFKTVTDRPQVLIADTIKGRGISFMEHPAALEVGKGLYRWHAGAPDDQSYQEGYQEIVERVNSRLSALGLQPVALIDVTPEAKQGAAVNLQGEQDSMLTQQVQPQQVQQAPVKASKVSDEYVAVTFGQTLVDIGARRDDLVVLDGDLSADCRIRPFEYAYPDRFIENGIAEQDMVSMAGGLARQGLLPVVNSFASFLAARANEQIYNNAGEKTKIIYALHYAGLIPAGPGKSHQSIRDISLFGALPNVVVLEPCNAAETRMAVEYCVDVAKDNCALRLIIGPSPRVIPVPEDYRLAPGRGAVLTEGTDAVLFSYGPVMLHEALKAAEQLSQDDFRLKVVNMPWLNRVDTTWLGEVLGDCQTVYVLDDHAPYGGLGDSLLNALVSSGLLGNRRFQKFAVEGYPACGTPPEALNFHGLSGERLADRILGGRGIQA